MRLSTFAQFFGQFFVSDTRQEPFHGRAANRVVHLMKFLDNMNPLSDKLQLSNCSLWDLIKIRGRKNFLRIYKVGLIYFRKEANYSFDLSQKTIQKLVNKYNNSGK
jgi:hypothetical protein